MKKYLFIFIILLCLPLIFTSCIKANKIIEEDDKNRETINGRVLEVSENSIKILSLNGKQDEMVVNINDETEFADNISTSFEEGNMVIIEYNGSIMESYPPRINALKIVANQPNNESEPDNEKLISLLSDKFPVVILDETNKKANIKPNIPFVIKLKDNPSTGYRHIYEIPSDNVNYIGEAYIPDNPELLGSGGDHYWAFNIDKPGKYKIDFILISPSQDVEDKISFNITVSDSIEIDNDHTISIKLNEDDSIEIIIDNIAFDINHPEIKDIITKQCTSFNIVKENNNYVLKSAQRTSQAKDYSGIITSIDHELNIITIKGKNEYAMFAVNNKLFHDLKVNDKVDVKYYMDYDTETAIIYSLNKK